MATAQPGTLPLFTDQEKPLLMLMDGHAMVHRSYHAISVQRHLSVSATGEDVTGVYGFINVFLRSLQDWKPSHCAIAFDTPAPTFRHQRFEEYKAQREAAPPELRSQFQRVKQLMGALGVSVFEVDGFEADDVIGTICRQAEAQGMDTVILTGDRDTFQLITPRVRVDLSYSIQDRKVYDEAELAARYSGLTAAQQPDFKALLGDSSDNIPGVPRIGEKRAIALLSEHNDLEGIYDHLEEVRPASVQQSLVENRGRAFENRILTTISREAPVELDPEATRFGGYGRQAVVDLLTELEFFSVINRLPSPAPSSGQPAPAGRAAAGEGSLPGADYQTVQTEEQ
ncbi:MAG: 5'-3' exonuclease H3TH domain-containing protein, partial [Dehalococcoidia bacterium]